MNSFNPDSPHLKSTQREIMSSKVCINDALPKELILKIFSYMDITSLCKCSQVCKFWYKCAFDGSNWKSINLINFQTDVQPIIVEKIAQRCGGFLRELNLKGCRNINDQAIERFTDLCRLIECLDLSECKFLTNKICKYLATNCLELKSLSLASCLQINDDGLQQLGKCCRLVRLDMSWCELRDEGLKAIADGCHNLQQLKITGCRFITSRGVGYISKHAKGLLLLNLSYCGQNITDESIIYLAIGCLQLRILSVSYCAITDVSLRALGGTLPTPLALELLTTNHPIHSNSTNQNRVSFPLVGPRARPYSEANADTNFYHTNDQNSLRTYRHSMSTTSSVKVPDQTQQPILTGCLNLRVLEVARCFNLTDAGLSDLCKHCTHLEKIDLEDCAQVTDATLTQLSIHCPQLNTIVLSHCDLVTDEGIAKLAGGRCGLQNLQRLEMDNCPLLTDSALQLLGNSCRHLRQLDLYDCHLITKQGINNLQLQYPDLQIQAYFAPGTPQGIAVSGRRRYCRCCTII